MKSYFVILCSFMCLNPIFAQENGGPYTPDENTILLMHFEGNLDEGASGFVVEGHGTAKSYVDNPNASLGKAIYFDNSQQSNHSYLSIPYAPELSLTGNWTIEFWLKIKGWGQGHNNWPVPIVLPTEGWDSNYFLEIPASQGRLKYGFNSSNGAIVLHSSENSITTGKWYHVALINDHDQHTTSLVLRDQDFKKIEEKSVSYPAGTVISTGTNSLKIGAGIAGDNYLHGYMDELRISNIVRDFNPALPVASDSSAYCRFYADEGAALWDEISPGIDNWFTELCAYWDRPGLPPIFPSGNKIKVYAVDKDVFTELHGDDLPSWKSGFLRLPDEIYLLKSGFGSNTIYEGEFSKLVKNTLGQLALKKRHLRDGDNSFPAYYAEGFGLYYSGYQPKREQILQFLNELGHSPTINDIESLDDLATSNKKRCHCILY